MADETNEKDADVLPFSKAKQVRRTTKAKATKSTKATAKPAKATKAKATKPKAEGGIVRKPSTVTKEGTQKDEFTGEVLPITAFPTVRQSDGSYVRGTVARKNLEAFRAARKAQREADKKAKAEAKAKAAAAKKAKEATS